ncbi:MAG: AAA family ATPase [Burkholderiales bacterium]
MARITGDQADGLRRLLARNSLRIITVASATAGVGKTSCVVNLAVALVKAGRNVLILDESAGRSNVSGVLGINARYDLLDVINRDKTLEQVLVAGPEGICVLPAARGVARLAGIGREDQDRLIACFGRLPNPVDVVLVDTATGNGGKALPVSLAAQETMLVLSKSTTSITGNYALIKTMSLQYAKRHFGVLVNKVRTEREAKAIFLNMAQAAQRYLSVSLDYLGFIPPDDKLERATALCAPVVEAFPAAASAMAFRAMAGAMTGWSRRGGGEESIEGFMQRLIQSSRLGAASIGI